MKALLLDGENLTVRALGEAVRGQREVRIAEEARGRVEAGREVVEKALRAKEKAYGVDTGFGDLADRSIDAADLARLQLNLIRSHASGTGDPLDAAEVRAILISKINGLVKGYDGVRWEVPATLLALLERDLLPVIPSIGSVGASGDLAPLAHLSLPLVGEGEVWWKGERSPAGEALERAGIPPLTLEPKEGLGLINGTQGISGILALALSEFDNVFAHAEVAAALSVDALRGTDAAFDPLLQRVRPHPGGGKVAARLASLMKGSAIRQSHWMDEKVQDAYSIRCIPAVLGSASDTAEFVRTITERELNSATGNPLCFPEKGRILSGGNFHGEPVAFAADFLAIGAAEVGSIAERRVSRLLDPRLSGLPPYLSPDPGLHSGYMLAQYTAAALVAENRILCHPASVDSIPTSGNQEDHVSMGFHGARKARTVVDHVRRVVAIELIMAAQGIEFLRPLRSSLPLEAALEVIRREVPPLANDRSLTPDLDGVLRMMDEGSILDAVAQNFRGEIS